MAVDLPDDRKVDLLICSNSIREVHIQFNFGDNLVVSEWDTKR
jgi:hypothetical protein